jgi:hypothetical protein
LQRKNHRKKNASTFSSDIIILYTVCVPLKNAREYTKSEFYVCANVEGKQTFRQKKEATIFRAVDFSFMELVFVSKYIPWDSLLFFLPCNVKPELRSIINVVFLSSLFISIQTFSTRNLG